MPVQKIVHHYGQGQSLSFEGGQVPIGKQLALAPDRACVLQGHHEDPELESTVRVSRSAKTNSTVNDKC